MMRVFVLDEFLTLERGAEALARRADELRARGVTAVGLTRRDPTPDQGTATPPGISVAPGKPGALTQARQIMVAAGLRVVLVSAQGDVRDPGDAARLRPLVIEADSLELPVLLTLRSTSPHDDPSAPRADKPAVELLQQLADAAPHGRLLLQPQAKLWLARLEDAIRVAMRTNRRNIGLSINLSDLLAQDSRALEARLLLARPKLWNVMLNESQEPVEDEASGLEGDSPSPRLMHALTLLARTGYAGSLGIHNVSATALTQQWGGSPTTPQPGAVTGSG